MGVLEGKVVLVTGGGNGIGRECALIAAKEGAAVVVNDLGGSRDGSGADRSAAQKVVDEIKEAGGEAVANGDDVSTLAGGENILKTALDNYGQIDILVCNAGIAGATAKIWDYPVEEWRRVIDIDLTGVFLCLRAVVPSMIAQNYGRICSTASIAGKEGNPNAGAYSAAKAGVIALTKSLGKELAAYDIAVNCITPAAARTRIFEQMSQEHVDYMLSKIPRGRFVTVEEIAAMVAWLVSAENSFTTGAVFDLSGGRATY